jgi:DNA-binding NarL/FixJ family response regulator
VIAIRTPLADDHAVVRAGIRNALQELPELEIVGEAGDGSELLTALAELKPVFLLIDVTMPNSEPVSAIRKIRATYPEMKILVVSAYDDDFYVQGMPRFAADVTEYTQLDFYPAAAQLLAVFLKIEASGQV